MKVIIKLMVEGDENVTFSDIPVRTLFHWSNSPTRKVKIKLSDDTYGYVNDTRVYKALDTERELLVKIRGVLLLDK